MKKAIKVLTEAVSNMKLQTIERSYSDKRINARRVKVSTKRRLNSRELASIRVQFESERFEVLKIKAIHTTHCGQNKHYVAVTVKELSR